MSAAGNGAESLRLEPLTARNMVPEYERCIRLGRSYLHLLRQFDAEQSDPQPHRGYWNAVGQLWNMAVEAHRWGNQVYLGMVGRRVVCTATVSNSPDAVTYQGGRSTGRNVHYRMPAGMPDAYHHQALLAAASVDGYEGPVVTLVDQTVAGLTRGVPDLMSQVGVLQHPQMHSKPRWEEFVYTVPSVVALREAAANR